MDSEREYVDWELEELERLATIQRRRPPAAQDFAPLLARAALLLDGLEGSIKDYVQQRLGHLCMATASTSFLKATCTLSHVFTKV